MAGHSRTRRHWPARDTILFGSGLLGVMYETVVEKADRPVLLLLLAAMMGLPVVLRADETGLGKLTKNLRERDSEGDEGVRSGIDGGRASDPAILPPAPRPSTEQEG